MNTFNVFLSLHATARVLPHRARLRRGEQGFCMITITKLGPSGIPYTSTARTPRARSIESSGIHTVEVGTNADAIDTVERGTQTES